LRAHPNWHTLPHIVPRHELDVHITDVHEHIEELATKVGKLEDKGHDASSKLTDIHRRHLPQLATKLALDATSHRLELDVAVCHRDLEEGLLEMRNLISAEVAKVRHDFTSELDALRERLQWTNGELAVLSQRLDDDAALNRATFATKAAHEEAWGEHKSALAETAVELHGKLDMLQSTKSSRQELHDAHASIRASHDGLHRHHNITVQTLEQALRQVAELHRQCGQELATRESLQDLLHGAEQVEEQLKLEGQYRLQIHSDLGEQRFAMENLSYKISDYAKQLADWTVRHNELQGGFGELRNELLARFEKLEQDVRSLDRREKTSWEQFLKVGR